MKKVGNPNSISRNLILSLALLLNISLTSFAQNAAPAAAPATEAAAPAAAGTGDAAKGKELFNTNCAACHKLDKDMTGPALRGISSKVSTDWLYKWIRNSSQMIKSGDAEAVRVSKAYNGAVMTAFPQLSDADIDNIIAYTNEPKAEAPAPTPNGGGDVKNANAGGASNNIVLGALAVVMCILIVMLFMVNNVLSKIAKANGIVPELKEAKLPIWKAFVQNQFLVLVSAIIMLLLSGYVAYGFLMQVGVDQDYEPIQPIHYSHRIHAGSNKIDCKYCHSSARVSKNAGIPSLNVCMNCHKNISEVSDTTATAEHSKAFYDGEIQKLYKAVGWDGTKYTGKTEPVKWVRIHNLQDFVYFNHSQHVSVAGVECQTCHGPVQTYEVMKQFAPLTMGWCVDCHRKTDVKMEGNAYYTKIHEELSKKYGVEKLTAAQMGGLECGKCHY
ncbi:cytochrome C [Flavobacterium branchiophilum]|uniref:Quinol:cytochrome c oxidoreductase pentaheme cytochrome subunit n=1 Tax=Flavobacterium branchiophilum TaxID=55197 RepID=A0A543G3Z8_9FLAO|nr:c-type cytochrome [Flavobacterium branchiophilum]OXA75798.1 cytochrome C [Flavobacterium branchiophilum] [Flavobacterium branchiophilum NBRC 15030 = ATCC 35035]TQM40819.1 quinol:cytochrome c oxidoreductase pentaheme cytochrome subunit [Flavobacterium branchiophilum]GEM54886.1 cytochrome c [Flavobacterium branchiophilum NBRC 15030 = ATCC 35035]